MNHIVKQIQATLEREFKALDPVVIQHIIFLALFNPDKSMKSFDGRCDELLSDEAIDPKDLAAEKEKIRSQYRLDLCRSACQKPSIVEGVKAAVAEQAASAGGGQARYPRRFLSPERSKRAPKKARSDGDVSGGRPNP